MTPLLWCLVALAVIVLLFALSACGVSGHISEQEREAEDAARYGHARLRAAAQAIVESANAGKPGMSTYVPCDLLYGLEDALADDRAAYPESKFDRVGEQ